MWNDRFLNFAMRGAAFDPMSAMAGVGGVVSSIGTILGGNAAEDAGRAQQQAAYFRAAQEEQAANESRAAAQRSALEQRRQTGLAQSALQARAAASGGGADDPTIQNLAGDIAARGEYQSLLEMYKGENRARGLEDEATGSRLSGDAALAEGKAKKKTSFLSAAGTLIGAAGSAYKTYKGFG